MSTPPTRSAREAILQSLPEETSLHGGTADVRFTYVPASHAKALDPDAQVVVGMRGAGKSFWWSALQSSEHRQFVTTFVPRLRIVAEADITVGFGEKPDPDNYPSGDVLGQLLKRYGDPRLVWRTVVLHALERRAGRELPQASDWPGRVAFVEQNPEAVDRLLAEHDAALERGKKHSIVLFDALDRSASDWKAMHQLIKGLLQVALDLRPYSRLRMKCFLRTDQLDEREVATFPDASKVLAAKVELTWPARELYGLLFQYLRNADDPSFLEGIQQTMQQASPFWEARKVGEKEVWIPSERLRRNEEVQRDLFHAMTGPWMGRDRRRGYPYTWVPNHLADAEGRTSPRSFLAALREAAEDSDQRYEGHRWALHYESIKRGVQTASSIRVQELQEDYPWVQDLMQPLRGKVVPCDFGEIARAWEEKGTLGLLTKRVEQEEVKLPPAHLSEGPVGVRQDLEDLGIFLRLKDDRVNIPDVFRVGYGLGRMGGVRPVHKGREQ